MLFGEIFLCNKNVSLEIIVITNIDFIKNLTTYEYIRNKSLILQITIT